MESPKVAVSAEPATGLEDITRSLRAVLRASREIGEVSADVAERELALAIRISENIRDRIVADKMLEEARAEPLMSRLRDNTHRAVDLFADATSVAFVNGKQFLESFADESRPPLESVRKQLQASR